MPKDILLEEFHLAVTALRGLPEAKYTAIKRSLDRPRLHAALLRAVRSVLGRYPALAHVHVTLSR